MKTAEGRTIEEMIELPENTPHNFVENLIKRYEGRITNKGKIDIERVYNFSIKEAGESKSIFINTEDWAILQDRGGRTKRYIGCQKNELYGVIVSYNEVMNPSPQLTFGLDD